MTLLKTLLAAIAALILAFGPLAGTASASSGYHAAYFSESSFLALAPGQSGQFAVGFTNTGTQAWVKNGSAQASLHTAAPLNNTRDFAAGWGWAPHWPSPNIYAHQSTDLVAPGETGFFVYSFVVPTNAPLGPHYFYGRPAVASAGFLEDYGYYHTVTVTTASIPTVAPVNSGPPIAALGTTNFYEDLLRQIGGPRVAATSILNDPSSDPHDFEATPSTAVAVADAKFVVVNGIGYDDFMEKLLKASTQPHRIVITVQDLLALEDDVNPHVWYDPATMHKLADAVTAQLSKLDPQNAPYFAAQKAKYVSALRPIDDKVAQLKARYAGMPVAFTEPVAEYLTDAIGLKVLTPPGFVEAVEQGIDPSPQDVADQIDLITGRKVKALLYNTQVTTPLTKSIQDLARSYNIPVVSVTETIPPAYKTYQEWMLAQLRDLERALAR